MNQLFQSCFHLRKSESEKNFVFVFKQKRKIQSNKLYCKQYIAIQIIEISF